MQTAGGGLRSPSRQASSARCAGWHFWAVAVSEDPALCWDGDTQHLCSGAQSRLCILTNLSRPVLEARPWARSGGGERNKTNPCLQAAHSLVGEETREQTCREQGREGRGLPATRRPLEVMDGSSASPPPPAGSRRSWKAQWGRGGREIWLEEERK